MGARCSAQSNETQPRRANRPGRSFGIADHPTKHPLRHIRKGNADRRGDAAEFPSDRAVWTTGAFCVAVLSVFAIAGYRYMRVWRPLQRHYLLTYAGTPVAGAFRTDAPYTLLMVVTRKGTRMALDNE